MTTRSLSSHSNTPLNEQEQTLFKISEQILELGQQAKCSDVELAISQLSGAGIYGA